MRSFRRPPLYGAHRRATPAWFGSGGGQQLGAVATCLRRVVYGGVEKGPQMRTLRTAHPQVLVATPGRLLDLSNTGLLPLENVSAPRAPPPFPPSPPLVAPLPFACLGLRGIAAARWGW